MSEPKLYDLKTSHFVLKVQGPASAEDFDKAAGKPDALLTEGVKNVIYRDTIPTFWELVIPKLEELTGVKLGVNKEQTEKNRDRAKTPEAKAAVKDVPEGGPSYGDRLFATFEGDKKMLAEINKIAQDAVTSIDGQAPAIVVDPSPTARAARGPGAQLLARADGWLLLDDDTLESKISSILATSVPDAVNNMPRDEATGRPTRDGLAWAMKAFSDAMLA